VSSQIHTFVAVPPAEHLVPVIQGVSRLVDITAGGDFLGLCDQNKFIRINKCPSLDGYGVMTA
jgi:hypothetical protein